MRKLINNCIIYALILFSYSASEAYDPVAKSKLAKDNPNSKISYSLQDFAKKHRSASAGFLKANRMLLSSPILRIDKEGWVHCYLKLSENHPAILSALRSMGVRIDTMVKGLNTIQAYVPHFLIESLATLDDVISISPVTDPVLNVGSVTTAGDTIIKSDSVRQIFGVTGSGTKIGVISNGVDGLPQAVATGDAPNNVLVMDNTAGGAEGTALIEILHDIAPDADIVFHTGSKGMIQYLIALQALASTKPNVIVDDVLYREEPMFEDGPIAQYVKTLCVDSNIVFVSASGNYGMAHYEANYLDVNTGSNTNRNYNGGDDAHDFSGGTGDKGLTIGIPAGRSVIITLQWNDPFGGSGNDYDLYLYNELQSQVLAGSASPQNGNGDPLEIMMYTNTGDSITANVVVDKFDGNPRFFEVFLKYNGGDPFIEYLVDSSSTYGHLVVDSSITVGAVPAYSADKNTVQPYSGRGSVAIFFPTPTTRTKPELCGLDGVYVTGAGGFQTWFFGTSAAAPHVAGAAALLLSANPALSSYDAKQILLNSATDIESPGIDYKSGYGLVNAYAAVSWFLNNPPKVLPIPDQLVNKGASFSPIALDNYVSDADNPPHTIAWTARSGGNLAVSISPARVATISVTDTAWHGTEQIWFVARDTGFARDSVFADFTVNSPPSISSAFDSVLVLDLGGDTTVMIHATDAEADPLAYAWYLDGVLNASETDSTYSFQAVQVDSLELKVEVSDGMATTSRIWLLVVEATVDARQNAFPGSPPERLDLAVRKISDNALQIRYAVPQNAGEAALVEIDIFDIGGKKAKALPKAKKEPGWYEFTWKTINSSGGKLKSGVYFLVIKSGKAQVTRRLLLVN